MTEDRPASAAGKTCGTARSPPCPSETPLPGEYQGLRSLRSTFDSRGRKNEFALFSQGNFAWLLDGEEEFNLIKTMKKASKLSVSAKSKNGSNTKDLYSMMGFTKAYNTARKSCA